MFWQHYCELSRTILFIQVIQNCSEKVLDTGSFMSIVTMLVNNLQENQVRQCENCGRAESVANPDAGLDNRDEYVDALLCKICYREWKVLDMFRFGEEGAFEHPWQYESMILALQREYQNALAAKVYEPGQETMFQGSAH